jgi:hypothetical protein
MNWIDGVLAAGGAVGDDTVVAQPRLGTLASTGWA